MIRYQIVLLLFIHLPMTSLGQQSISSRSGVFPQFKISQGQLDADGLPLSGAKLCVLAESDICFQMPNDQISDDSDKVIYEFGLDPHAERISLIGGGSWVFFSATFYGGGSGTLDRLAMLRYEIDGKNKRIVNLMPFIGLTNVSDQAIWMVPKISKYPILVDADFVWGTGEIHFGRHFFRVEAWCFDTKTDRYREVLSYQTTKRYEGGDVQPVRVIAPERKKIMFQLEKIR